MKDKTSEEAFQEGITYVIELLEKQMNNYSVPSEMVPTIKFNESEPKVYSSSLWQTREIPKSLVDQEVLYKIKNSVICSVGFVRSLKDGSQMIYIYDYNNEECIKLSNVEVWMPVPPIPD